MMKSENVSVPVDGAVGVGTSGGKHAPLPVIHLETLLAFLKLDETDRERLRELSVTYRGNLSEDVSTFYGHLLSFEETAHLLQDPAFLERLKQIQENHLLSMLQADWDDDYAKQRRQIGRIHAERGVKARFLLGTYNLFVQQCIDRLIEKSGAEDTLDTVHFRSLVKAVFLDLSLTLDEYIRQYTRDMRQALDLYWNVNQELKQFAQLTSHDLKTPLATVTNLCEEIQDEFGDTIPSEALELIQRARQTILRMSATIDELLSVVILGDTVKPSEEVPCGIAIHEAIERVRPALEEREIELITPKEFPHVIGNKVDLREVFYNLLSNSAKYIKKTPGRIEMGVQITPSECTVFVKDNGPGIPRSEHARIFAPFRRLAMHRDEPGTGLGLYFTRLLVEKQGGKIWVESDAGEGTCFFVQLKRARLSNGAAETGERQT